MDHGPYKNPLTHSGLIQSRSPQLLVSWTLGQKITPYCRESTYQTTLFYNPEETEMPW